MHLRAFLLSTMLFLLTSVRGDDGDKGALSIQLKVNGFMTANGQIYILLYNYENQYPRTPYRSIVVSKSDLKEGVLVYEIPKLAKGKYGVIVLDDENANGTLDFNLFGIPEEGYGFSNNRKAGFLSLPQYETILVEVSEVRKDVSIALKYN